MRRRRRQSDTSEVALMAVMTKAMGAFLILMVFAMQYYIPDFTAEQIAAIVNRSIGSVCKELAGAVDRMKKGDFTRQDMDALQREIEVALAKLAQAEGDITRLQTRLDQSVSQLRRVEGERTRLETETQELKAQIARLKAFDPAKMQAEIDRLSSDLVERILEAKKLAEVLDKIRRTDSVIFFARYQNCGDDVLALDVARQRGKDGKPEPLIPTADSSGYTLVRRGFPASSDFKGSSFKFRTDSIYGEEVSHILSENFAAAGDTFAIYLNYLNTQPAQQISTQGPSLAESSCRVRVSVYAGGGTLESGISVSSKNPFILVGVVRLDEQNRLVAVNTSPTERAWFEHYLQQSACTALTCDPASKQAQSDAFAALQGAYQSRLMRTPSRQITANGEAVTAILSEFRDRFLTGQLTQTALSRLAALAVAPASAAGGAVPDGNAIADATKRLSALGTPPALQREFLARANQGWWTPEEFTRRVNSVAAIQQEAVK